MDRKSLVPGSPLPTEWRGSLPGEGVFVQGLRASSQIEDWLHMENLLNEKYIKLV